VLLSGCFHDDDDDGGGSGVTNADPTGYYDVTGTAEVRQESDNTTPLVIMDLQAMAHGNQIKMLSVEEGLLYDVTITSINENTFSGDVAIYRDGVQLPSAVVSGMITEGSSIIGALTGEGPGNGTFELVYSMNNDQLADMSRIGEGDPSIIWVLFSHAFLGFSIGDGGVLNVEATAFTSPFSDCTIQNGSIGEIADTSLYSIAMTLDGCSENPMVNGSYTGFAASRSELATDDTLVMAISNGDYALYGDLEQD
jgi:hypothetical protein